MNIGIDFRSIIAAKRFPSQIAAELEDFAQRTLTQPQRTVRRKRIVGKKTIEARLYGLSAAISILLKLGFKVHSLRNVGEKHIEALHAAWVEKDGPYTLSPGRVANLNCYLRLLFNHHFGKHDLLRT